jgi:hypothetical protein
MTIGLDRHYYPVVVPTGTVIKINSSLVTLPAGTYWAHDDEALTSHPSLYLALRVALGTAIALAWSVDPHQPAGYAVRSGVRLRHVGATALTVDWDLTSPLLKQLLGWPASQTGTTAFATFGSSRVLDGPIAALGSWLPWSCYEGRAEGKDSTRERVSDWSSDHPEVAQAIVWRERKIRALTYPLVMGGYVLTGRASVAEVAEQARVGLADDHNTFERLWAAAGRDLKDVLVVHDLVIPDLQITTHSYEIARLASRSAAERLESLASRSPIAADLWQVRIPYVVTGGSYGL